jgi:hypothetical protein
MPKRPGGSFNAPKVAKGKSPRFTTNTGKSYSGTSGTKRPTGNRPTPSVAKDGHPSATTPGPTKPAIKRKAMPTPSRKAGQRKSGSY